MDISSLRERDGREYYSVSELNSYIKKLFDADKTLRGVTVKGEISNFKFHASGHLYFSLKDAEGQVRAVMFKSAASTLKFKPENGMRVTVRASVTVYPRDGLYQLYVNSMSPDGIGELYLAYEQLKEKLYREGLFDVIHKKQLPKYPMKIGVITSQSGAAVRDIINVISRRFPVARIYLYPSLVQGDGAEADLIHALEYFNASRLADVIIIGRGGGSIEDLWAFNGERLARKIFECEIPVISAVGHETDFTICDFVSDLRAPTPSAAAELAVPDIRELVLYLMSAEERAMRALTRISERKRERLDSISRSPMFTDPSRLTEQYKLKLSSFADDAKSAFSDYLKELRHLISVRAEKLGALSPLAVLSRGYAIAEHNGKSIKSVNDVSCGSELSVRLFDGSVSAAVTAIKKK